MYDDPILNMTIGDFLSGALFMGSFVVLVGGICGWKEKSKWTDRCLGNADNPYLSCKRFVVTIC